MMAAQDRPHDAMRATVLERAVHLAAVAQNESDELLRERITPIITEIVNEAKRLRIVAVLGGGDWADASVDHLVVPDGVNLDEASKARSEWYRETYVPRLRRGEQPEFLSFPDWLIEHHGARLAGEADIEVWDDA